MKISTKGRYALRILADIAEHGVEKNVPIREIAERQGFSDKYLEGIVSRLSSAGLVKSGRGKYGGYRLVKSPAEYNVYEILYAAEDSIALVSCLEDDYYIVYLYFRYFLWKESRFVCGSSLYMKLKCNNIL
ncbi:MAG: Rrf2 family transcriptional regulator [Veillonella sp.]|nr:Rrf2 family transcriptional regulator [Veillonella sp.]